MGTPPTLLDAVSPMRLAYLHVIRSPRRSLDAFALGREHFRGPLIVNDSFDRAAADRVLDAGEAAAVSFGRSYIGNPDLVRRLRDGLPLADFDLATLYTPGPKGYTDYPAAS